MGNNESQHSFNSPDGSTNPCQLIECPGIGTIKVCQTVKKSYMQIKFVKNSQHQSVWIQNLKKIKHKNPTHLLLPINYSSSGDGLKGFLGSDSILVMFFLFQIDYELYPYLLSSQISQRKHENFDFRQTQLWLLLYYLLQAHQQMEILNLEPYGSIQPKHIFLNKQGQVKVANSLSWPDTRIQTYKFTDSKFSYFPPEVLNHLSTSSQGKQGRDSFSIGLTILSAMNLENFEYLYSSSSHGKACFNEKEFIRVINQMMKNARYSEILRATVCCLVELSPEKRMSGLAVEKWLQRYRASILCKEDFVITDPPSGVVRQVQLIRSLLQYSRVF